MHIRWRGLELPSLVTCEAETLNNVYGVGESGAGFVTTESTPGLSGTSAFLYVLADTGGATGHGINAGRAQGLRQPGPRGAAIVAMRSD